MNNQLIERLRMANVEEASPNRIRDLMRDAAKHIEALEAQLKQGEVPKNERAAFEKQANDARFFPAELSFARTKSPSGRDEYVNSHLQSRWEGWQARASVVQPEPAQPAQIIQALIDSHKRDVGGECDESCDIVAGMEAARDAVMAAQPALSDEVLRAATHVKIAADNIVQFAKANPGGMCGWLDDACTHADVAKGILDALLQSAQQQSEPAAQPVAEYQYRTRVRNTNTGQKWLPWSDWQKCSEEQALTYKETKQEYWQYEVRKLYAAPVSAQEAKDAERYKLLKEFPREMVLYWIDAYDRSDAAIDAAMQQEGK